MISRNSLGSVFPVKKLSDVVEFLDNLRRPVTESERKAGPYPYFGANGLQGTIDDFIFDEPLLLLAEDGGHFDNPDRGIAYRVSGKTWVNNHAHVLRAKPGIDLNFLCRVLENYDVTPFVTGTTRGKLTKAGASEIPIPLPPLPEQRSIAAILDQADALRIKRLETLAQLEELQRAIFIEMFGDPISNPMHWKTCSLEHVSKKITDGTHKTPTYVDSGVEFLSAKDLKNERIQWGSEKFISEEEHKQLVKRCNPELGDVLLAKSGSLGAVAVIDRQHEFSLFESLCLIKHDRGLISGHFLTGLLRVPSMLSHLLGKNKGIAIKHLHLVDVRNLMIPIPPIRLQAEYENRIIAVEKVRDDVNTALLQLDALFASLQHQAFRGEL